MDAVLLSGMIKELLLDHDSLELPGLGSFVVEEVPAAFSDKGYTVNPPYRHPVFTGAQTGDGLLVRMYAENNTQLSTEDAAAVVSSYIGQIKEELEKQGTVELPGLGRLRSTRQNRIFFVPDESLDISPDSCGLLAVSLKTHAVSTIANIPVPLQPAEKQEPSGVQQPADNPESPEKPEAPAGIETIVKTEAPAVPETTASTVTIVKPEVPAGPEPTETPKPPKKRLARRLSPAFRWSFACLAAVALALGAFAAIARLAPDFTDRLLYTEEELSIINYPEDGLGLPG